MPIGRAALIATFFCKADSPLVASLWNRLTGEAGGLALVRVNDDLYQNIKLRRRLTRSPVLDDTRIIQLFLNEEEPAPRGWAIALEMLKQALSSLLDEQKELWGYSLCYQSAITAQEEGAESQQALLQEAFPGSEPAPAGEWPFGRLWLLARPRGKGQEAHTTYALLGPAEREEQAVREFLAAPEGLHPRLELALHKAYHQGRQYGRASQDRVTRGILDLQAATDSLLTSPHGLARAGREEAELDQLAGHYANLTAVMAHLRRLRNSIQINLRNLREMIEEAGAPAQAWWQSHERPLRQAIEQLDHDLAYAQPTLEAARAAAEVLRARFAAAEARAESRTNLWLAFIGFALGAGELITEKTATAFLGWLGLMAPKTGWPQGVIFATRLGLAFAFGLMGVGVAWAVQSFWRRIRSSG